MRKILLSAAALTLVVTAPAASASASVDPVRASSVSAGAVTVATKAKPKPKTYKNCTALNKVYKNGVGKPGARDKTSGKPVTTFTVDKKTYDLNKKSDRDKDGIACEKR